MTERMRKLLADYAQYLRSDEASTDDFLTEGTSFDEVVQLMDLVATAVEKFLATTT